MSVKYVSPRNIEFGAGYWDLVNHYGGDWYSLCAVDWGSQLQSLGSTVTNQSYGLEEEDPILDTLIVTVNGQIFLNGLMTLSVTQLLLMKVMFQMKVKQLK